MLADGISTVDSVLSNRSFIVHSYSEHRILTPKNPKQSGKTVVTILVTTVSIFRMVLSASRHLPCGGCPEDGFFLCAYTRSPPR